MLELLNEESFASEMREVVEPALAACRVEGRIASFDGKEIAYEYYPLEGAVGNLLICHGFTESGRKFREMVWYFRKAGYAVFVPTHRGHGDSFRKHPENPSLTHVDRFDDYVRDVECFIEQVVTPNGCGLPLDLYAHSMGGAIGIRLLQRNPALIRRAVLTAPMVRPRTNGIPRWLVRLMSRFCILTGRGDKMIFASRPYAAPETFEKNSLGTSPNRYAYYAALREQTPALQNTGASYRWINESVRLERTLMRKRLNAAIQTPVCLFQAELEEMVWNEAQVKWIARIPAGRLASVPYARHEIYQSDNKLLGPYVENILEFLRLERDWGRA